MAKRATGFGGLVKHLKRFGAQGEALTRAVVQSTGDTMVATAKRNAPKDVGALANSIVKIPKKENLSFEIEVGMEYGAFVEFGTGALADVPSELADEAVKFKGYKGTGNFDVFLTEIKDWCRRHGIPEEASYPIAVAILRKGLKPRPYIYPALVTARKDIVEKLKTAITRLTQQMNSTP